MIPTGIQSLLPPGQQGMAQQPPPPGMGGPQGMAQQPPPPGMGGPQPQQQPPGELGIGSAVGSVNEYVDMYQNNPDPLLEQYGADGDFLKLLALQKIKSLQEAFANDYAMQMAQMNAANGQDAPMTTQVENEVVSNAMQGMGPPMQGMGPSMPGSEPEYEGMLGLPIDNSGRMTGAGGGIVAFANGTGAGVVEGEMETYDNNPLSLEELLIQQLTAGMEGGTGRESPVTQYNLDQVEAGKFRDQREENWKARQAMLAEQQDPERRRQERIDQAIHAAATTYGGIGEMGARIAEGDRRRADAYEDFDLGMLEGEGAHIDEQLAELLETQSGRRTLEKDFNTSEDEALAQVLSSSTTLIQSQKQLEAALAQAAKATNQGDYVNWRISAARMAAKLQGIEFTEAMKAEVAIEAIEEHAVFSTDATGQATVARIDAQREENWLDARQDAEEALVESYMQISGGNREFQDAMAVGDQPTMNRLMGDGMAWWEGRNPDPRPGARAPAPTPTSHLFDPNNIRGVSGAGDLIPVTPEQWSSMQEVLRTSVTGGRDVEGLKAAFDEKFGEGAADFVLSQP